MGKMPVPSGSCSVNFYTTLAGAMMVLQDFQMFFYTKYLSALLPVIVLRWILLNFTSLSRKLPHPPGPSVSRLLSGNLNELPPAFAWHTYIAWGKKYGNILHYRVYNKHTIILNSYEDNVELLEKRSAIYSDRPYMPMMDLLGWLDHATTFMSYGPLWRAHRRLFQQHYKRQASKQYHAIQTKKVYTFLHDLLTTPEDFMKHNQTLGAAVILAITYAHDVSPEDDYFVRLAEKSGRYVVEGVFPDNSLFYSFPGILRYVPAWLPGAGFKRKALEGQKVVFAMRDSPMRILQNQMKEGTAPKCVVSALLEASPSQDFEIISGVAVSAFGAGAETTVSAVGIFFQAMLMYPDVQRRAQEEIDAVVGFERCITYDDRSSLPYIEALYRELLRWRPTVPLSVSHATSSDDVYKGYFIPKGTTVTSNIWAIAHNPSKYTNPDVFNPSRFFDENGNLNNDDMDYAFGFGRRICPGRHIASATVWLTVASVLQNFNIKRKRSPDGEEIPVEERYADGFVLHPLPFQCSIIPRSQEARDNILLATGKL